MLDFICGMLGASVLWLIGLTVSKDNAKIREWAEGYDEGFEDGIAFRENLTGDTQDEEENFRDTV